MRTGLKNLGILAVILGFALFSCTSETVETEMQRWCDCEQNAISNPAIKSECSEMMKDITRKYEFDPEAALKIRDGIIACKK